MAGTHTDVRYEPPLPGECRALADILMCIGDKWTVMVVANLAHGPLRYSQIFKGAEGISQRMLTLTLKALERDGLVKRTMFHTIPPKVEYELTERGWSLAGPLGDLWYWARDNRSGIEKSRREFEARRELAEAF